MTGPSRRLAAALAVVLVATLTTVGLATPDAGAAGHHRRSHLQISWGDLEVLVDRTYTISGTVTPAYQKPRLRKVALEVRRGNDWKRLHTIKTGGVGRFELTLPTGVAGRFTYRVVALRAPTATWASSATHVLDVRRYLSHVTTSWPADQVKLGDGQVVKGTVSPVGSGRTVYLQRAVPGGWVPINHATTTTGSYAVHMPARYLGGYRMRVVLASTRRFGGVVTTRAGNVKVVNTWGAKGSPGDHAFTFQPIQRWNPCAPINYQVNSTYAPKGVMPDIRTALARVSTATGISFAYKGRTKAIPQLKTNRYATGIDLIIFWANYHQTNQLKKSDVTKTIARGRALYFTSGFVDGLGHPVRKSAIGSVVMNRSFNRKLKAGGGKGETRVEVLMHEMGHVMGLQHAKTKTQIMYPTAGRDVDKWGRGDLAGLQAEGWTKGCITQARTSRTAARTATRTAVPAVPVGTGLGDPVFTSRP